MKTTLTVFLIALTTALTFGLADARANAENYVLADAQQAQPDATDATSGGPSAEPEEGDVPPASDDSGDKSDGSDSGED